MDANGALPPIRSKTGANDALLLRTTMKLSRKRRSANRKGLQISHRCKRLSATEKNNELWPHPTLCQHGISSMVSNDALPTGKDFKGCKRRPVTDGNKNRRKRRSAAEKCNGIRPQTTLCYPEGHETNATNESTHLRRATRDCNKEQSCTRADSRAGLLDSLGI